MSAFYGVLLTLLSGFLSIGCLAENESEAAIEPTPAPSQIIPRDPLLGRNVLAAQAVQLSPEAAQLIDLTTPVEHFSALFLAANVAQPRGMVILLSGEQESFDSANVIGPLRRKLPDAGWHTLSINQPDAPLNTLASNRIIAIPVAEQIPVLPPTPIAKPEDLEPLANEESEAEIEDEPTEEAVSAAPPAEEEESVPEPELAEPIVIPEYPQRISNFLDAAIAYAQAEGAAEIILLGHHEGAQWVLNYQNQQTAAVPVRLVLISPRNSALLKTSYPALIEASNQPIADFYYKGRSSDRITAQQRLAASRRANREEYKQVALTAASGVHALEQERLFRRVKGWLNKSDAE